MTIDEVAGGLAERIGAQVLAPEGPSARELRGAGYELTLSAFFGGWQVEIRVPDRQPILIFGEAVGLLAYELRRRGIPGGV